MTNSVQQAADHLWDAQKTGVLCDPVRNLIGPSDIKAAYEVQSINNHRRMEQGARLVGHKIGLTSKAVQEQLGVDQPDYGMLFHDMDVMLGGEIPWSDVLQPKVEAEIAFVLGDDLTEERLSTVDIISAIDYSLPALEIVGSRVKNWDIGITDTIADNASSAKFVIGHNPVVLGDFDLLGCAMAMKQNGDVVSTGKGSDCLGSPINATLWLARTMAAAGHPLKAGDVVLSGALGKFATANPGDQFEATIKGLGSVNVRFSPKSS
ncbi:2-keto-4-pentenoate hydratase [Kiloniella sp.]|uniref:2-keto-4-pentenoate hydratase n=1 Tax=Kiloniella sp. TaxID=1938587 RepID=UPI003B025D48